MKVLALNGAQIFLFRFFLLAHFLIILFLRVYRRFELGVDERLLSTGGDFFWAVSIGTDLKVRFFLFFSVILDLWQIHCPVALWSHT